MDTVASLQVLDYFVIALILIVSLGIGVLFAVKDFRNATRDEYLFGGRRMSMIPVALSLFATYTSGVAILGSTTEIYWYGPMPITYTFGMGLGYLFAGFTIVPLMYPLRLTSLYEYLQLRYESTVVRLLAVALGMLQTLCYMAIALLAPALALQAVIGMPLWISLASLGFIGTVYTAIGGIKSVVWTDVFQAIVMLAGFFILILKGNAVVGGGLSTWKIAQAGGRTNFHHFSLDPRTRNTWWGSAIGTSVLSFAVICNQSSLQRISAIKTIRGARNAFFISIILNFLFGFLLGGLALVIYAYNVHVGCDPYEAGLIKNRNQLPPYYVMHAVSDLPGARGIFLAMIFSGSLSTLSSGLSALAALTVEDLLKRPLQQVQESTATLITKACVVFHGFLIIGLAYIASTIQGPLSQMFLTITAAWAGPVLGIFLLGAVFPWGNKYGAVGGCGFGLVFCMWIILGNQVYGTKPIMLPSPPIENCFPNSSLLSNSISMIPAAWVNSSTTLTSNIENIERAKYGFFLYEISFQWYGLIATASSLVLGTAISYCFRNRSKPVNNKKLFFPFLIKFWFPQSSFQNGEINGEEAKNML